MNKRLRVLPGRFSNEPLENQQQGRGEKAPIGLILCAGKSTEEVEKKLHIAPQGPRRQ